MKKLFTLFAAAVVALTAMATDYTGQITVEINGLPSTQDATIAIEKNEEDGTYKLNIKNFMLKTSNTTLPVGNIVVDNLKGYTVNGLTTVVADQTILIEPGNMEGLEEGDWMGPFLQDVPIIMTSQFNDTDAKADIDIDMRTIIGQFINVKFNTRKEGTGIDGDVNADGSVNAADVTYIYKIILGQ